MTTDSEAFALIYEDVKKQDGKAWLRILGQTHWQFNELPFWVLLKDKSQIVGAIDLLQKMLKPLQDIKIADVAVSFIMFEHDAECSYGFFKGDNFFHTGVIDHIYAEPECSPRKAGIFDIEYPDDPWAMKYER